MSTAHARPYYDRLTFQGWNRVWYSARNLTPTQVSAACEVLRRIGLQVEATAA